jgi:hypothetical protein
VAGQASGGVSVLMIMIMGLAIHFAAAIALARMFQSIVVSMAGKALARTALVCGGLVYGAGVWTIARFLALRFFDNVMYTRVQLLSRTFFAAHLLYGAALGGFALTAERRAARLEGIV